MSQSGKQVLRSIKNKVSHVEQEYNGINRELSDSEANLRKSMAQCNTLYTQLATLYLPSLEADSISNILHAKRSAVEKIYSRREERRRKLSELVGFNVEERSELEDDLQQTEEQLENSTTRVGETKQNIGAILKENTEYLEARTSFQSAREKLAQLQKQREQLELQGANRLPDFKDDTLFSYLLQRGVGTDEAAGNFLTRWLDRRVAAVVNFDQQKEKYDTLLTLPKAMERMVTSQRRYSEELKESVRTFEEKVEGEYGLPTLLKETEGLGKRKSDLVHNLETLDKQHTSYEKEIEELNGDDNSFYREAIGELRTYLEGATLAELRSKAWSTPSPEDDHLVERIAEVYKKIERLENQSAQLQKDQKRTRQQLDDLKDVERHFVQNDYDSSRSYYQDSFDMDGFLMGYLVGNMTASDLTRQLDSNRQLEIVRRSQSSSDYSGSSSSSSSSSSSWSSSSSDSFSSGGGFGGGGFSSGDGF